MGRLTRGLKHMWNTFSSEETISPAGYGTMGASYGGSVTPHQPRLRVSNERSITSSIYSRMAVDIALADLKHVRLDDDGMYKEDIDSGLNDCLTVEPNIDQTPDAFLRDFVLTLFGGGHACVVPIDMTLNPATSTSWDVLSMRVGEVTAWHPRHVTVSVYDDRPEKGLRVEKTFPKNQVAIVQNPFYTVMNEPNSMLQRLMNKLALLDSADDQVASGKLDVLIQLPYTIKSEARRDMAEKRRTDLEFQLSKSQHGIGYVDATEKITQLNRPVTNTMQERVEYLQKVVYDQLGITAEILNGTADEKAMLTYHARIVKPVLDALKQEMIRKFLTKTARTQKQSIMYFKNPFELMTLSQLAEVGDVLSRNEIIAPNELRTGIGMKPSSDPAANKLQNSNMPAGTTPGGSDVAVEGSPDTGETNAALDEVSAAIDAAFADLDLEEGPDEQVS